MVTDVKDLYVVWERGKGYNLDHIYLNRASAELALLTYFTPTRVQNGTVKVEVLQAKTLEHCCEM